MMELKPCKKCGVEHLVMQQRFDYKTGEFQHKFVCMKCGSSGEAATDRLDAREAWNRRAT